MTREELEHIIRASADVTQEYEFVIVGSQSILGSVPNPEDEFTMSAEADIYPMNAPGKAAFIEGALGEGSQFHETYGYYAQGVGPETAVLPSGWIQRVHRVQNTTRTTGSDIASTWETCSCQRQPPAARRTASSARRCCRTAMSR